MQKKLNQKENSFDIPEEAGLKAQFRDILYNILKIL